MTRAPNVNYNAGYNPYQIPINAANYNNSAYLSNTQSVQSQAASAPLSHIPYQEDVLTLTTKPNSYNVQNILNTEKDNSESLNAKNNIITENNQINSSLQAQMPAPDIKTGTEEENAAQTLDNPEETQEKALPSLDVGVVDAPNNASLTPITDDINSRATEIERVDLPEIQKSNEPKVPISLGKKPINAGKLSAGLMFASIGTISVMLIPKGISKIVKLIKHIKHK